MSSFCLVRGTCPKLPSEFEMFPGPELWQSSTTISSSHEWQRLNPTGPVRMDPSGNVFCGDYSHSMITTSHRRSLRVCPRTVIHASSNSFCQLLKSYFSRSQCSTVSILATNSGCMHHLPTPLGHLHLFGRLYSPARPYA